MERLGILTRSAYCYMIRLPAQVYCRRSCRTVDALCASEISHLVCEVCGCAKPKAQHMTYVHVTSGMIQTVAFVFF